MKLLHLQQVSVVAHTTHNRLRPDLTQPNPTRLNITPNLHHPPQPITTPHYPTPTSSITILTHSTLHPIHVPIKTFHLSSIYLSSIYTDAYTLTRLIVNKLLTLYISIDILTFMWYNKDNEEGPFYMLNI